MQPGSVHDYKLPPPRQVSPAIRTARWGLLVLGVAYGSFWLGRYRKREASIQEQNAKIIEKRVKEYNVWFADQSKRSMDDLAKEAGVVPKA